MFKYVTSFFNTVLDSIFKAITFVLAILVNVIVKSSMELKQKRGAASTTWSIVKLVGAYTAFFFVVLFAYIAPTLLLVALGGGDIFILSMLAIVVGVVLSMSMLFVSMTLAKLAFVRFSIFA